MLKKIKEVCLSLGIFSLLAVPLMVPAMVYAAGSTTTDNTNIAGDLCTGSNLQTTEGGSVDSCADDTSSGGGLTSILRKVIQIFSIIVGFVAVVMIIVGGIKYITSGGDSGNVSGAKNTIVYAIIGLIIVALAQILVHFVIKNIGDATGAS